MVLTSGLKIYLDAASGSQEEIGWLSDVGIFILYNESSNSEITYFIQPSKVYSSFISSDIGFSGQSKKHLRLDISTFPIINIFSGV